MRSALFAILFVIASAAPAAAHWGRGAVGGPSGYSRSTPGYAGFGYASYGHADYNYVDNGWGGWGGYSTGYAGGGYGGGHGGPCWDCANVWDGYCQEKAIHGRRYTGFPSPGITPNGFSQGHAQQ